MKGSTLQRTRRHHSHLQRLLPLGVLRAQHAQRPLLDLQADIGLRQQLAALAEQLICHAQLRLVVVDCTGEAPRKQPYGVACTPGTMTTAHHVQHTPDSRIVCLTSRLDRSDAAADASCSQRACRVRGNDRSGGGACRPAD